MQTEAELQERDNSPDGDAAESLVTTDAAELRKAAKEDPDILGALAMPTVYKYLMPKIFLSIWSWLVSYADTPRVFQRLALGMPRGFGKTTLIKLLFLYLILFTRRKFILVLAETGPKAQNILADLCDMLSEPNIVSLFGNWKAGIEKDTTELKKFTFRGRPVILAALGCNQGKGSVRGLNLKNERPDVILLDDIQSKEDSESEAISDKIYSWMLSTVMKSKDPEGCMFLFIGNMYPSKHSILKKLIKSKSWVSMNVGGILQNPDGSLESLWEELQPLDQLLAEYEADLEDGHPEIFLSEVLNLPDVSVNLHFDASKVPEYPWDDDDLHQGNFIIIDPATGKANKDAVSILYGEVHDGKPVAREILEGSFSPGDTIWNTLSLATKWNCPVVFVESNAYQSTLCYWFNHIMAQSGFSGIEVVEIYAGRKSKNSRIVTMLRSLEQGEILLHNAARSAVLNQGMGFNPKREDNTDGILDCVTYMPRVLAEFGDYLKAQTVLDQQLVEAEASDYAQGSIENMLKLTPA